MRIELFPLEKVVIDGVPLSFGMTHTAVEATLGRGHAVGARCYYFHDEMALDYRDDRLEFIEFLGGIDGILRPTLCGVSVFDAAADELLALLRERSGSAVIDGENGYAYQFPSLSVGVYREIVPGEVASMIEEATDEGSPMSPEDIALEQRRATHWASIGLGAPGYYAR